MVLDPAQLSPRQKLILTGLYLAKYDAKGLKQLGFRSFIEAFNVIGYALGARPASIKNYRDEFDPLFGHRKGWHKRPRRDFCIKIFQDYQNLDFNSFGALIQSFTGVQPELIGQPAESNDDQDSSFAKRLATGLAAERYFESVFSQLSDFTGYSAESTTLLGCGYDFQLSSANKSDILAIEVKGLISRKGSLSLTEREHDVASKMKDRFFLFVVKNFAETPFHEIYRNPLSGTLRFSKQERVVVHRTWQTAI